MNCQIFNSKGTVIGIDNVPGQKKLYGVRENMDTMIETLKIMKFSNVTELYNEPKKDIQAELKRIEIMAAEANKTGEPFLYWLYYAGHGAILANDGIPTL